MMQVGTDRCHLRIPVVFKKAMRKYDAATPRRAMEAALTLLQLCDDADAEA
jgi:hypothetical protein